MIHQFYTYASNDEAYHAFYKQDEDGWNKLRELDRRWKTNDDKLQSTVLKINHFWPKALDDGLLVGVKYTTATSI